MPPAFAEDMPTAYDPRALGLTTPVRHQGQTDLCGAFAAMASLETSLVYRGQATTQLNEQGLSPYHLAYFMHVGIEEREAGNIHPLVPDSPYGAGVTPFHVAASLAAGKGAMITTPDTAWDNPHIDESLRSASDVHLTDAWFLSPLGKGFWEQPAASELSREVKETITSKGSIVAEFSTNPLYFNWENSCFYAELGAGILGPTHYAAIVGWDDGYSRENFNEFMRPITDGAWLIKNSWGSELGNEGYYWISYEDASLVLLATLIGEPKRENEAIYFYDLEGWCDSLSVDGSTGGYAANVFVSKRDETLDRIQISTTGQNTSYEAKIYRQIGDMSDPCSGELVSTATGVQPHPGYHTISLDSEVLLCEGENFSVVVEFHNESFTYPIAVEVYTPDPETPDVVPTYMGKDDQGNPEISLVSSNGSEWSNPAGFGNSLALTPRSYVTNACIKALTLPREAEGGGDPEVDPPHKGEDQNEGAPFSRETVEQVEAKSGRLANAGDDTNGGLFVVGALIASIAGVFCGLRIYSGRTSGSSSRALK